MLLVLRGSGFFMIETTAASWLVLVEGFLCLGLRLFVLSRLTILVPSCLLVTCLEIAWVELVAGRPLICERQSGWRENFLLFIRDGRWGCLLLSLEHLLLLHALSLQQDLVHPSAQIVEFEVCPRHWTCVLLLRIFLSVNTFVICEIDIVNVIIVICHGTTTK